MTSFLITSPDKAKRLTYSKEFCRQQGIDPFDIALIEKDETTKNTHSIGIDAVKQMQKKIFLKPFRSKTKAVIIEDAQLLTTEAQNSLLKVLEEPPEHTIIVLGADTKESLLPTIISRCQVLVLPQEKFKLTPKKEESYREFIATLSTMGIGERLKKAELLAKDKEKALTWITGLIIILRKETLSAVISRSTATRDPLQDSIRAGDFSPAQPVRNDKIYLDNLQQLQSLYTLLKSTNVNVRFAIETTLLSLNSN